MLVLAAALAIDLLLGEYWTPLHPVVWIGTFASELLRETPVGKVGQFLYGAFVTMLVVGVAAGLVMLCEQATANLPIVGFVVSVFFLKASFALTALGKAGLRVARALEANDLPAAREGLRSLCSRDPAQLDGDELVAASVESLAENASDSFVAPLFWFAIGGVPGAMAYRAINTLDAMIGYHGRYEWLGKFAARLDDVANVIPARLTAALLLIAGTLLRADVRGGWRMYWRDGGRTPSPNAGCPMATMAGLLGVVLEKRGVYRLGDGAGPRTPKRIDQAWRIVCVAAALMAALVMMWRQVFQLAD
jgi:adenosylcobinamide-phosphate synthase